MKLTVGSSIGHAKDKITIYVPENSSTEIKIGNIYDMSERQINLFELKKTGFLSEINELRCLANKLKNNSNINSSVMADEALKIADTADKMLRHKKWYSISGEGIIQAAKSLGKASIPLTKSAEKIVDILNKIKDIS